MKTIKIKDILDQIRLNGHLGWIKILDASKITANNSGTLTIATTIFKQKFVSQDKGDEILVFNNKQLNITKLENKLTSLKGIDCSLYVGGKSFIGIIS